jgi:hypothetical protein
MLDGMLVVMRFVRNSSPEDEFTSRARTALAALAACKGYLRGRLARALDDPTHWTILTEWESVGSYRRALSAFDVKVNATPLLAESLDEPSAFETLAEVAPGGALTVAVSDRAEPAGELR